MENCILGDKELTVFERAVIFAAQAHSGAYRKGSATPYIVHPMEAAAIAVTITEDQDVLAAAVLHDVLEDTAVSEEEMCSVFGDRITKLVAGESEDKRRNLPAEQTWQLRKSETITFLKERAGREEKILALADKLSNLRAIHKDMCLIGDDVWLRFNQKDKRMHGWMYCSICDALKSELGDTVAWREFSKLTEEVFHGDIAEI